MKGHNTREGCKLTLFFYILILIGINGKKFMYTFFEIEMDPEIGQIFAQFYLQSLNQPRYTKRRSRLPTPF